MLGLVASGMSLIAATYGLARFGYGLFLPQLAEAFQLGSTVSGAIQAGSFLSYCVAAVLAARMAAHPRRVVAWAGASAALGAVGVAISPGAAVLAMSVVVAGAGAGFATPGLVALIERTVAPARRESAQTIVNAGTGAGIIAAGILITLTIGQWRLGWAVIAALAAAAAIATLRADHGRRPAQIADRPTRIGVRALAPLARPLLAAGLAGASSAAIWTFGRSVMAEARPHDEAYSIVAWMVLGLFGLLGAVAGRLVQTWSVRFAWTWTAVAMAVATTLLGLVPSAPWAAYGSAALFGASYTALSGVLIVWAVRLLPGRAAEGTVALFIALAVGQAAGSVVLGALLGMTIPAVAFGLAGVLGIVAVLPAAPRTAATSGSPAQAGVAPGS